jgi:hypothetical protein
LLALDRGGYSISIVHDLELRKSAEDAEETSNDYVSSTETDPQWQEADCCEILGCFQIRNSMIVEVPDLLFILDTSSDEG